MERKYLTLSEIQLLIHANLPTRKLETARDIFLFSCFTSLSISDAKNLQKKNIENEWINVIHTKTGMKSRIPVLPVTKLIFDKYIWETKTKYLFPSCIKQHACVYLKKIGDICGLEGCLTSSTARNTFVFMALKYGVPIELLSILAGYRDKNIIERIYMQKNDDIILEKFASFAEKTKVKL
jgi:integrase